MKIKDLIKLLQQYDPETHVAYDDNDYEYGDGCTSIMVDYCTDDDCDINKRSVPHIVMKYGGNKKHVTGCRCPECFPF